MNDVCGFDCLGAEDDVGAFDYMSLVKAVPGLLSGAGGMLSSGGGGDAATVAAAAERARLEEERRRAEQSATTMKIVLGIVGGLALLGGVAFAVGRK